MVSVGRDGPVHLVLDSRRTATLDTAPEAAFEVSLAVDVFHRGCVSVYDKVASGEGAVLNSLVSDMERDRIAAERSSEVAPAVECRESSRLAFISKGMCHISLNCQCRTCKVASEAESFLHSDNGCVIIPGRGTRDCCALCECDRAHPSIQMVIVVRVGRGGCAQGYDW